MKPELIEKYWYSIDWDVAKLWAMDLPVAEMPIEPLMWHLDVPVWPFEEKGYCITPREVLNDPQKYHIEYARTMNADTAFPIEIIRRGNKWMILDGIHRFLKTVINGGQTMMVRKVPLSGVTILKQDDSFE